MEFAKCWTVAYAAGGFLQAAQRQQEHMQQRRLQSTAFPPADALASPPKCAPGVSI